MSKELEALEIYLDKRIKDIKNYLEFNERSEDEEGFTPSEELQICYLAKRMLAIDNAKPSEALECLKRLDITIRYSTIDDKGYSLKEPRKIINSFDEEFTTIKQALIKAQEQEKVLKIIKEKKVDIPYLYELFECIKQGKDTIESALKQYNDSVKNGVNTHQLTKEEFDLLKRNIK